MANEAMLTSGQATTESATAQSANEATTSQAATGNETATGNAEGAQQQQTGAGEGKPNAAETAKDSSTDGEQPKGDEKQGDKPKGAPEAYEDFKVPEGVQLDAEALEEFKGIAKELNLSQEDAQKVADIGPKLAQKWAAKQADAFEQVQKEWAETSKADKEFGGDKLTENLALGKKALDQFGTPGLRQLLNESGLGNHPEVIRFMVRAGKAISEDRIVPGNGNGGDNGSKDPAKTLYPNQN